MHLPFFRLMRSLSTLRITKLELAGKNEIAWRLGSSATRRLITDLLCGRTTQAHGVSSCDQGPALRWHYASRTSSDTFRSTPSDTFMLHVFFHHSFVIHTSRLIHPKKQQPFKYYTTWSPFCWSQPGLTGHWLP